MTNEQLDTELKRLRESNRELNKAITVMLAAFCDGSHEMGNIERGAEKIALAARAKAEGKQP